jgi:hypothetical protein
VETIVQRILGHHAPRRLWLALHDKAGTEIAAIKRRPLGPVQVTTKTRWGRERQYLNAEPVTFAAARALIASVHSARIWDARRGGHWLFTMRIKLP